MRPLQLKCPNPQCRLMLMIPGEAFGQRVKCAGCGKTFEERLRKQLHAAGRCPDCKHNRIYQPLFRGDD